MSIKKNVTEKQLEANRNNAKKSTGPRTERGKKISRLNSVKHGILASNLLVTEGLCKEDQDKFWKLLASLCDEWHPLGLMEELYVQQVGCCFWRLGRVLRAEAGAVQHNGQSVEEKIAFEAALRARDDEGGLTSNVDVLEYLLQLLTTAKIQLEESGFIYGDSLKHLEKQFGAELITEITPLNNRLWNSRGQNDEAAVKIREESVRVIGTLLDKVREPISLKYMMLGRRHYLKKRIGALVGSIPTGEELDRILGYEKTIHRELDAAITNLERSQRRRRGDFVPPPVKVSIGD